MKIQLCILRTTPPSKKKKEENYLNSWSDCTNRSPRNVCLRGSTSGRLGSASHSLALGPHRPPVTWAFLCSMCSMGLCLIKDACFPQNWLQTQTTDFIWHKSVTQHWVTWGTFKAVSHFSQFWFYTLTVEPDSTVWCFQMLLTKWPC